MREDWINSRLEELIIFALGGDWGKAEEFQEEGFVPAYCIRGAEFKNWAVNFGKTASLRKLKKSSIEKRNLKAGDIIVEISGGGPEQPVGRTELISHTVLSNFNNANVVCTNFLRMLRPSYLTNADYTNWYLKYFYSTGKIRAYQAGSNNLRNLKFKDFLTIEIPLAPLPEQRAIVAKIETLFSDLDKGIADITTAQAQLKVYRQAVLKKAFEGELTKQWKIVELRGVIQSIQAGKSFRCEERPPQNSETGVLKVSAISWGEFQEDESKTVTDFSRINPDYFVKEGDFLLSRANTIELVGKTVIVKAIKKKLMLSDKTLRIVFEESINPYFILYFLRTQNGRSQIESLSTGNQASMRNIGQERIKQIKFPYPPTLQEQHQIVREIESRLSVCDKVEQTLIESLEKAKALRQSILKKAFEGSLLSTAEIEQCKQVADYEPAAVLLAKIKAEKTKKCSET